MIDLANILGEKEAVVYRATLELGEASIAHIAKKTQLPRSSCYLIVQDLKKRGLVSELVKNNKTRILPEPPNRLIRYIELRKEYFTKQEKVVQESIPILDAIYNRNLRKPLVRFYEGIGGIKTVLEETLTAKEIYVLCSGYDTPIEKNLSEYLDSYFEAIHKRGIRTFELLGQAHDLREYIKKFQSKQHSIKEITAEQSKNTHHHMDKIMYDNTLILISFEFLNATVITHKPIVSFEMRLFDIMFSNPRASTL